MSIQIRIHIHMHIHIQIRIYIQIYMNIQIQIHIHTIPGSHTNKNVCDSLGVGCNSPLTSLVQKAEIIQGHRTMQSSEDW